jgi:hypothetical protein
LNANKTLVIVINSSHTQHVHLLQRCAQNDMSATTPQHLHSPGLDPNNPPPPEAGAGVPPNSEVEGAVVEAAGVDPNNDVDGAAEEGAPNAGAAAVAPPKLKLVEAARVGAAAVGAPKEKAMVSLVGQMESGGG